MDLKYSVYGIMLCIITAITAIYLSNYVGITLLEFKKSPLSPIIFAILLGLIINNITIKLVKLAPGFQFCIKYLLKLGIIFLGIRLSLLDFVLYGSKSLIVVIPCILCTIKIISLLKNKFDVSENLSLLIAVGTSICGATAIVALAPSINAKKTEITYAIANITVFGLLAMFIYPIVANLVFSNDLSVGLFLGSSIHETA
ncbi:MAG: putative sulfate exporter family transporter, partial [Candidatus Neomarinimicrobiota bacterium]|nr:putative sulfate exporter family transporter [Candidatus Neomarinimicrobiota bacterium]